MIGVDFGSSEVKWFDGKNFGKGIPDGKAFTVGISSSSVFTKISEYPLCKGRKLREILINDVSLELSLNPKEFSLAFCPLKREEKGCKLLVFVGKKESLELPKKLSSLSQITVDVLGGINAILNEFGENFTLVDAGKNKVAVVTVRDGVIENLEVLRGGFDYHAVNPQELLTFKGNFADKVYLTGGGAFSEEFKKVLGEITKFEIPEIEPFGKETPVFLNAYGLYNFKKSNCKAFFKGISIFSSELLRNNRGKLVFSGISLLLSLLFLTGAETLGYLSKKEEYLKAKGVLKEKLSEILSERVVAPDIQVPQKLEKYRELSKRLKVSLPSLISYVDAVSKDLTSGIEIFSLKGSVTSSSFKLKGRAKSNEDLKKFVKNLKGDFKNVSISSSKEGKEGISFTVVLEGKVED
jgi:hypothetical protein